MARRRSAERWVKAVLEGREDCDGALEEHLDENYTGPLRVPSLPKAWRALCFVNMGWLDRVLDLLDGPMTAAEVVKEFGLEPFLPLFDRWEDASYRKGEVVQFGPECWGYVCRVIGRRPVTPYAMLRLDDWELYLDALDGKDVGFVSEAEVEPVEQGESVES